jgi:uncharacterized membrane protein
MLSILFGLSSALAWGAGDFIGGVASRKTAAYRVVLYAEIFGLLLLLAALLFVDAVIPPWPNLLMALFAGGLGSSGLLILYRAMASGQMSVAAPISALLAAVLPVVIGFFTDGFPGAGKLAGFLLAFTAVWMIAQETGNKPQLERLSDLSLPLFSGLCFGAYFIILHRAAQDTLLWPMIASRTGGVLALLVYALYKRESWRVERPLWPYLMSNGTLDIGGNAFFILAGQVGRLDIAAVLSSLYPGATVILAALILKENINLIQKLGILAALIAIALMTL